uniref:Uncharacterized protein n=1 Tax=Knipowitschia caucasica TaxID=637954 RepID=A0AAV2JSK7_KNICA
MNADSDCLPYHCAWCPTDVQLGISSLHKKSPSLQIPGCCRETPLQPHSPPYPPKLSSSSLITSAQKGPTMVISCPSNVKSPAAMPPCVYPPPLGPDG